MVLESAISLRFILQKGAEASGRPNMSPWLAWLHGLGTAGENISELLYRRSSVDKFNDQDILTVAEQMEN